MLYEIFFVLQGEITIIGPIKLDENETISELRKKIKEEKARLRDADADALDLYSINATNNDLDVDDLMKKFEERMQDPTNKPRPLTPTSKLSKVWPHGPPEDIVHILVQLLGELID